MNFGNKSDGLDENLPNVRTIQGNSIERNGEPLAPSGITEEEVTNIRGQATELIRRMAEAKGSEEMEILKSATSVGLQAQSHAAVKLDLLKAGTYTFLDEGGTWADIVTGLQDRRLALDDINPKAVTNPRISDRVLTVLPFFRGRFNPVTRALKRIAIRYEPASRQGTIVESRLQEGRALLIRDNVELRLLYKQVEEQQPNLSKNAYLGELLVMRLT